MSTALQSEERAFESLYRLHRPLVYAYALSTLRHSADAEDATQTAFLNAYCALHRGVSPRDTPQWLLAITRNVCRDKFRDAKRRPKEEPLDEWIRVVQPDVPDYSVSEICKEISELNPRHRQILLMREFEGRSYAEISAQLGVSEAAVQTLLARARRSLRDELQLGMTCAQARRVALRDFNGVAVLDERRALKRHLRRCAECATFVGRRPRTPVGQLLWLTTMPFRRLWSIAVGTSAAPVSTTAGGAGAVAAKLVAMTVVGTAAVGVTGVTVKEISTERTIHPRTPAVTRPASTLAHHSTARVPVTLSTWHAGALVSTRPAVPTHVTYQPTPPLLPAHVTGDAPASATQSTGTTDVSSAPPGGASSPTPPATAQPPTESPAPATPQDSQVPTGANAPVGASAAAPSAPSDTDAAADSTSAQADASTTGGGPATSDSAAASPQDPAAVSPPGPPSSPPGQLSPPGQANGNHGNGNAVGPDGIPPGQAAKADGTHGHQ